MALPHGEDEALGPGDVDGGDIRKGQDLASALEAVPVSSQLAGGGNGLDLGDIAKSVISVIGMAGNSYAGK